MSAKKKDSGGDGQEKQIKKGKYTAKDITVLEGLEPVRKRPGMYIGTTGQDGLHHLYVEVFDNSRDEAMGGHANEIEIVLLPDDTIRIADNGRGIPVDIHPSTKVSALEIILTTLHAGGKFGGEGYKISGGLHGVGISVVNALSIDTNVYVHRDGSVHHQAYIKGEPKSKVKEVGKSNKTGTVVSFKPDEKIFLETTEFSLQRIINHIRQQAYLVPYTTIRVIDGRNYKDTIGEQVLFFNKLHIPLPAHTFRFTGGIASLVRHYNKDQKPVHKRIFFVNKEKDGVQVSVSLQYVDDISSRVMLFANNIHTPEGGTHLTGFKAALTRTINGYMKNKKQGAKELPAFSGDDVWEGLTAVISVAMPEIQFEGQTKAKLGSTEARSAVEAIFGQAFSEFLEEYPADAKNIMGKISLAYEARLAARAAKETILRKGALEGMTLPGKLADCQVKNASEAELFIVEGDSAGGTAKMGRDRRTQAILPIKGKILNVERVRIDKALASDEIRAIVVALGTAIGDTFNPDKLRYHKIIIAADADVDGSHIRTLLLTLFYRYFKELISRGVIYIALPPLYKIKKGKEVLYAFTDEERNGLLKSLGAANTDINEGNTQEEEDEKKKGSRVTIQRYKGLGEMNFDELRDTTMDPTKRVLKRVKIVDAEEADRVFDMLMGGDVPPRKQFIQNNAKFASLDI